MRTEECREWRQELGAYALGQLPPDERAGIKAHIEGCPDCRTELEGLASVVRLMPLADPERFGAAPALPPSLANRVAARIAAERRVLTRRRRWRVGLTFSGATAALAAAVLAIFVLPGGGGARPQQRVAFADVPAGMQITATLEPHAFGTEIHMYVKGVPSGTLCRVFLRGTDGSRLSAGSFRYRWGENTEAVLSSALDLSRTRAVGVRVGDRTFIAPVRNGQTAMSAYTRQEATT
ncbi:MAG: anti-sigma factor [Solirubrobacterales bacterium]